MPWERKRERRGETEDKQRNRETEREIPDRATMDGRGRQKREQPQVVECSVLELKRPCNVPPTVTSQSRFKEEEKERKKKHLLLSVYDR